jgi:hypothetical protein
MKEEKRSCGIRYLRSRILVFIYKKSKSLLPNVNVPLTLHQSRFLEMIP